MSDTIVAQPAYSTIITFKRYNKQYNVNLKIFNNTKDLNSYYFNEIHSDITKHNEIYACFIYGNPCRSNKNCLGELIFSTEYIYPGLVSHEIIHAAIKFYDANKIKYDTGKSLDFSSDRKEEHLCILVEELIDKVYGYINTNKIPCNSEFNRIY